VTYALGIASSSGQGNEAVASKPLPVFRTLKKNVRSAPSKAASYGASEIREEVLRKDALEEIFVASRKRFLAMAYSILRNREDAEDAVPRGVSFGVSPRAQLRGAVCTQDLVDAYRIECRLDDEAETQTFRGQVAFRKRCLARRRLDGEYSRLATGSGNDSRGTRDS